MVALNQISHWLYHLSYLPKNHRGEFENPALTKYTLQPLHCLISVGGIPTYLSPLAGSLLLHDGELPRIRPTHSSSLIHTSRY